MSWQPLDPSCADTDFATSSLVPLVVLENDATLRFAHNRQAGHAYGDASPLEVRPPTTDGPLGPIWIPIIVQRPRFRERVLARVKVSSPDGPVDAAAWLRIDDRETQGPEVTIPDGERADLTVQSWISPGVGFAVAFLGITADAIDEVAVTTDGGVSAHQVVFDGRSASTSGGAPPLPSGVEYVLPSGRPVYLGTTGFDGDTRFWPPLENGEIEVVGNVDTTGNELATIRIHGWAVRMSARSTIADAAVEDGAPLQASDLPAQRTRVVAHWRGRSCWCLAGPVRDPVEDHGARGHSITSTAIIPASARTSGALAAVLVCRISGGAAASLAFGSGETAIANLPDQVSCVAMQVRDAVSDWPSRDLLFRGDWAAYFLLSVLEQIDVASLTDVVRSAVTSGSGSGALVHVAATTVVEVTDE